MYLTLLSILGILTLISHANPVCQSYLDTFEDIEVNPVASQLATIGTYHGITYQGWVGITRSLITGTTDGVEPIDNQMAVATELLDLIQIGDLTLKPFGYLETSQNITSFNLASFYFGCAVDTHSPVIGAAQACTIYVVGYLEDGAPGPVTRADFFPASLMDSPLQFVDLSGKFQRLGRVVLALESAAISESQASLFVDNVLHCNWS